MNSIRPTCVGVAGTSGVRVERMASMLPAAHFSLGAA
jgi:hypothetical protein